MISLFHRLPLGGKLLAKQGDEGQPNNIQAISLQKAALYSTHVLAFPFWESGEHPLPYPCFPLWGKCLRKQTIEVDSNFFLFPSLPLGGKVDKAKLWTNEGQPNNIQAFFQKSRFITNPRSGLPRRGSCRLLPTEEVFAILPLA